MLVESQIKIPANLFCSQNKRIKEITSGISFKRLTEVLFGQFNTEGSNLLV